MIQMSNYFNVLIGVSMLLSPSPTVTLQELFDQNTSDAYWEAFLCVAHGNKEAALQIINALPANNAIAPLWKEKRPHDIDSFFDKLFLFYVASNPQWLNKLGLFESIGIQEHNAQLNDLSVGLAMQNLEQAKEYAKILKSYKTECLSHKQQISHKVFSWKLRHRIAGEKFLFHEYKVTQLEGLLLELPDLFIRLHPLKNQEDVERYLVRLSKIAQQIQQVIEFIQLQRERKIFKPRFVWERVLDILETFLPENVEAHIFYTHIAQNAAQLANYTEILAAVKQVMHQQVYPAYRSLQEYFMQILATAETNHGLWALPDGDAYYAYLLQEHTTTDLSAEAIHTLGLQEVKKIHDEMRQLLAEENIHDPNKEVGVLMQELAKDPRFFYPNTDEGRQACLAEYTAILERSRKELAHLFDITPKAGVIIERAPLYAQDSVSAYYSMPSVDGARPGIFFISLRNMQEIPKYGMETLLIHEAEPGHHFQLALQAESDIPLLRRFWMYTAYVEGWALYAEKLAYEQGFYSSASSKLGHLQDELLRAARLVIDTGIHYKRWSKEEAINYMVQATGYHYDSVVTEVERYFALPGQACAYKIGQLKILELRQRAKEKLGKNFSIKEFHNVVLQLGAVPLTVLEEVVDAYIHSTVQHIS